MALWFYCLLFWKKMELQDIGKGCHEVAVNQWAKNYRQALWPPLSEVADVRFAL